MAGSHGRMLVIDLGGFAMSGERAQDGVETPALERLLLRLHPGAARGRVGRDRFRSGGEIFADVIEINQVAARSPNRASIWPTIQGAPSPTAWTGVRPEAGPHRAGQHLTPSFLNTAFDRARVNRRAAALRVRQRQLRLPPGQRLALAPVLSSRLGSTIGTMPPSVSTTIGLLTPAVSGNSVSWRPASYIARAWANVIRWIVLSPIAKP